MGVDQILALDVIGRNSGTSADYAVGNKNRWLVIAYKSVQAWLGFQVVFGDSLA